MPNGAIYAFLASVFLGLVALLLWWRWLRTTFPCRCLSEETRRLTRKQLDRMMNLNPDLYLELVSLNPHLDPWHLGGIEPPA